MNWQQLLPQYAPYAIGAAVALAVLIAIMLIRRPRFRPLRSSASVTRSSEWQLPGAEYSDRRSSVRREGSPVKVLISSPTLKAGIDKGMVLDRSTGGLRIATQVGMTPGSTLQVRAQHAPETTPWVTVIVRNCKVVGRHYELGCEFDKTPPWNVLLLFG